MTHYTNGSASAEWLSMYEQLATDTAHYEVRHDVSYEINDNDPEGCESWTWKITRTMTEA